MANKADTEIEKPTENRTPKSYLAIESDDVCCGLILRQIGDEWGFCPFCGDELPDWATDWVQANGQGW